MTPTARLGAAAAALLSLSGCAFSGIDLMRDTRVSIQSPGDGDTVSLPMTVRWTAKEAGLTYAVFVDKTVIKSGATLRAVVPSTDTECLHDSSCPDPAYLARHGVYVTDVPHVVIPRMTSNGKKREAHRIIVIVLKDGRRDGEGAFSRTVYVKGAA